jgi:predicted phage terminase large subunit-like protein
MILTRWHQDDLAGRILPEEWDGESGPHKGRDGRDWHVICLPAVCDREDDPLNRKLGESLWPEWFSEEHWRPFKLNRRTWSSLYQQKPTPDDGDYFKAEYFNKYSKLPSNLIFYGASDFAVTDGSGDFTEHGVFGVDKDGNTYVVDWWRDQKSPDVWIEAKIDLIEKWKPTRWFSEAGVIRRSIEPFLKKRMKERKVYMGIDWLSSISDKPTRARSIQGRMAMGMVFFPDNEAWAVEIERQMLSFPAGRYDDAVDVMGLIGRGLDSMRNAGIPKAEKSKIEVGTIEWVYARTKETKEKSKYRL